MEPRRQGCKLYLLDMAGWRNHERERGTIFYRGRLDLSGNKKLKFYLTRGKISIDSQSKAETPKATNSKK